MRLHTVMLHTLIFTIFNTSKIQKFKFFKIYTIPKWILYIIYFYIGPSLNSCLLLSLRTLNYPLRGEKIDYLCLLDQLHGYWKTMCMQMIQSLNKQTNQQNASLTSKHSSQPIQNILQWTGPQQKKTVQLNFPSSEQTKKRTASWNWDTKQN